MGHHHTREKRVACQLSVVSKCAKSDLPQRGWLVVAHLHDCILVRGIRDGLSNSRGEGTQAATGARLGKSTGLEAGGAGQQATAEYKTVRPAHVLTAETQAA